MELVIFLIAVWAVSRAWKDSKAAYRKSKSAYMAKADRRFPNAPKSRRAATALRHDAGYWSSQLLGGFPATRHGFAAGWHQGRAAQTSARTAREEARTRRLENQADHAERLSGYRERQQEAMRRWREALDADQERAAEGTVTGEGSEGSGEGSSPADPRADYDRQFLDLSGSGASDVVEEGGDSPAGWRAPRVCVACGNPENGPRRGGGNWGPLVTYTEPMFDGDPDTPRLIHRSHFEDESSGFYGRPYQPGPAPESPGPLQGDCYLCGLPLAASDRNGVSHQRCEDAYERDNAAHEVRDNRDLDDVERDLREQGKCPRQIKPAGWDGGAIYCGQPLGGNDGDEFCPQHEAEWNGDDDEAADELNAHVRALLEAEQQESPAPAQSAPSTEGGTTMAAAEVTYRGVLDALASSETTADARRGEQRMATERAHHVSEAMQQLGVDAKVLSAMADHIDAQEAAEKALIRVIETAQNTAGVLQMNHNALAEAHENAPVRAAERDFYGN